MRKADKRFSVTGDGAGVLMDEARQDAYKLTRDTVRTMLCGNKLTGTARRAGAYERGRKGIIYERYSMVTGAART